MEIRKSSIYTIEKLYIRSNLVICKLHGCCELHVIGWHLTMVISWLVYIHYWLDGILGLLNASWREHKLKGERIIWLYTMCYWWACFKLFSWIHSGFFIQNKLLNAVKLPSQACDVWAMLVKVVFTSRIRELELRIKIINIIYFIK